MKWKITPADRKIIREYAAHAARRRPRQVHIRVGERYNVNDEGVRPNFNVKLVDPHPTWDDSDLHDMRDLSEVKAIELTPEGEAEVDYYVYSIAGFGDSRDIAELETNIQTHIRLVDGKPRIWKLTDTDYNTVVLIPA